MTIVFTTKAKESLQRSERGVVGMIVKGTVPKENPLCIYTEKDIPSEISEENKEQIKLAMKGYINAPSKIIVYVVTEEAESYEEALKYFEFKKANWSCCPSAATDNQTETLIKWVKEQRGKKNRVKMVLPEIEADDEGIINYATKTAKVGEKVYTAEQFCSRIAGLLAGTPSTMSSTFAVIDDVTDCEKLDRQQADAAIDAGKFILYNDGEKIKVGRGVNSLTTIGEGKSYIWKKIKVVETMDMINDDLTMLFEDNYIGKYPNTYDNKSMAISAARDYLEELKKGGLIDDYHIGFDVKGIKEYLIKNKGFTRDEVERMKENALIQQNTDEKLFLAGHMHVVDALEDVEITIEV